jgi:DNA-binding beta-propeller fold protein YncE
MRRARIALARFGCSGHRTFALVIGAAIVAAGCTSGASHATAPSQSRRTLGTQSASPNPFTVTARFEASSLGLDHPIGLAIGPDGNLYVTDTSQVVAVISPEGNVLQRWGTPGTGPGELSFVSFSSDLADVHAAIAVDREGQVYVVDNGNRRIQVFSATGAFIRQFGTRGTEEGQFLTPFDIAVGPEGDVYVSDDQGQTVSKFSPPGLFEWRIGGQSENDPDLLGHQHLASVDTHGRVVMANDDAGRILYVDGKGHKVDAFSADGCDVTVDALGDTFVNSCLLRDISIFDRTHKLIGSWSGPESPLTIAPRFGPKGEIFAIARDGTILRLEVALP